MWRKFLKFLGSLIPLLILLAYATIIVCFLNRWDSIVPFTLIPFWLWSALGAMLSLVSYVLIRNTNAIIVFAICILFGLIFSYETRGMLREMSYALSTDKPSTLADRKEGVLRIITVNCGDGNVDAARSVIPFDPDIVFFQKAPLLSEITEIATKIYGVDAAITRSQSNAIIARGEFLTNLTSSDNHAEHARLRLLSGTILDLTNINLPRSLPTLQLWDTGKWKPLIAMRKQNRKAIRAALVDYDPGAELPPRIIGGDFGTLPGDDIFRPLKRAELRDSYQIAGSDLGNTYPSKTPFFRHSQFWISASIDPVRVRSISNKHSDQKMVLCDFTLEP